MAHDLTETPTRGTAVTVPDGSDNRTAASVGAPFQVLTNRIAYLEAHVLGAGPATNRLIPLSSGRNDDEQDPLIQGFWRYFGNLWGKLGPESTGSNLFFEPDFPIGVTITQIRARYSGSGGHSGFPSDPPTFSLGYWDPDTSASTAVATVTDSSGTAGAYDANHYITSGVLSHVVTAGRRYFIWFKPEGGTNALDGKGILRSLDVSWTPP